MTKIYSLFIALLLVLITITACRQTSPNPEVNSQATIDAAVAATDAAQASNQATIDAAVAATTAAQAASSSATTAAAAVDAQATANTQTAIDTAVQATVAALPTPVPVEQVMTMSEETLAALIDEAVTTVTLAAEQSAAAATHAVADNTITAEEAQAIEVTLAGTDESLAYVDELIGTYTTLYGDLAADTVAELQDIEASLDAIEQSTAAMSESLEEINDSLEQGVALAEETIVQVEDAAQTASAQADALQEQAQAWATNYQTVLDSRAATAIAIPASQTVSDPKVAIEQVKTFFNTGQMALADGQISATELNTIAQYGANATASLDASGIPALQSLSGHISEITTQFARGDANQARLKLDGLTAALRGVPLEGLSIELPSLPERDSLSRDGKDRLSR
ncbi:MAG: hypothetical protein KDJ52_11835 [Anaerolineae bacterium]|nr:hypothetical protein [Anaerolineae bacterium]